jgi:hypothetical protein
MNPKVEEIGASIFGLDEPVEPDWDDIVESFDPTPHEFLFDPVGWIEQDEFAWSKQKAVAESVEANRYTAVPSAHDTGKSYIASRLACWWLDVHPAGEAFVVTTAPTWNQVHAILWREIRKARAKRPYLPGRTTLDARWYIGGSRPGDEGEELVAYGRKPADYDQAAFQGIHARYVLVIIDEGSGVPKLLYDAVDSLATNEYARVLAIGNPDDPASEFANICKPGSGWNVIQISAFDTPAFTGESVPDDLLPMLVSPTWVEERKKRWGEASPTYQAKVLGQFPDIGEDTLISPALIRKAEENDLSAKRATGQFGFDIARYGSDKTVGYRCQAGIIRKVHESAKQSTMTTAGHIKRIIEPHKGKAPAVIDVVGLGSGVVDRLREQKVKGIIAYNAGWEARDKTRFKNRRSELMWEFREAMEAGEIDLPPQGEDEDLKAQMGAVKWTVDSRGRIEVESKKDMAKRGLPSPDHLDAALQSWMPGALRLPEKDQPQAAGESATITGDLLQREL